MSDRPAWLSELTDDLTARMIAAVPPGPIGVHVQPAEDDSLDGEVREVSLFYGRTEILGGPQDGRATDAPYWLDLNAVADLFDRIEEFAWQTAGLGAGDDLGPHVAIEGVYQGRPVRVRFLACAPERFPPARAADTLAGRVVDLW